MLHTLWSVKGGSGVTVTAAALGAVLSRRHGGATVVDLCGDQPAALGLAQPDGPGLRDWLATPDGSAAALGRLLLPVHDALSVLPTGTAVDWSAERSTELVAALRALGRPVVIDAGVRAEPGAGGDGRGGVADALAASGTSVLVTRPCYLALRRASACGVGVRGLADALVAVVDVGRALDGKDVGQALGVPVAATVEVDPAVARAVDSGMLARRMPRSLAQPLRGVA